MSNFIQINQETWVNRKLISSVHDRKAVWMANGEKFTVEQEFLETIEDLIGIENPDEDGCVATII